MTIIDEDRDLSDEGILKEADVALFEVSPTYYILPLSCLSYPRMYKISLCFSHFCGSVQADSLFLSLSLLLSVSISLSFFLSLARFFYLFIYLITISNTTSSLLFHTFIPYLSRRLRRVLNCVVCLFY